MGARFSFSRARRDGGQRAHALAGVLVERLDDGQLAGAAARLVAARRRRGLAGGRTPVRLALAAAPLPLPPARRHGGRARCARTLGSHALDRAARPWLRRAPALPSPRRRPRAPRSGGSTSLRGSRAASRRRFFLGGLGAPLPRRAARASSASLLAAHLVVAPGLFQRLQARRALAARSGVERSGVGRRPTSVGVAGAPAPVGVARPRSSCRRRPGHRCASA